MCGRLSGAGECDRPGLTRSTALDPESGAKLSQCDCIQQSTAHRLAAMAGFPVFAIFSIKRLTIPSQDGNKCNHRRLRVA
jgi:hypothetical protein